MTVFSGVFRSPRAACVALTLVFFAANSDAQDNAALGAADLARGSQALQKGDLQQADTAFADAIRRMPSSAEANMGLGLVKLREGQPEQAESALKQAAALDHRLGGVHLFLGIADYQLGRGADAAQNLRAELALSPDSLEAATWLALVLMNMGQAEAAIPVIDHAVLLKPDDAQLLYLQAKAHGMIVKAALGRLYALDPESALVHQAMAESLDQSGDFEKAVTELQAAVKKEPSNPDLLEALGEEQQKAGHLDAAAAAFSQVLTLNKESGPALSSLGQLDVQQGRTAEGVALLRRAQAAHAGTPANAYYLGTGLAKLGQDAEAEPWLLQAVVPDAPGSIRQGAWNQLARVYRKLNRPAQEQNALARLQAVVAEENKARDLRSTPEIAGAGSTRTGQGQRP